MNDDMKEDIPTLGLRLLKIICPDHLYEEIEGDVLQQFSKDLKKHNLATARRRFIWNVVRFIRPGIILRNKINMNSNQLLMLGNYFKTSLRHATKSKVNFGFKLGGLVLSLMSLLVIVLFVLFQLSFDKFHNEYQQIYRVNSEWVENETRAQYAVTPPGVGPALRDAFPEVVSFVRITSVGTTTIRYQQEAHRIYGIVGADSTLFDLLRFDFVRGDRRFLSKPGTIALTESTASKFFGDEDPVGKSVTFSDLNNKTFEVAAVIRDIPVNSHLDIAGITSFEAFQDPSELGNDSIAIRVDGASTLFVKLTKSVDAKELESRVEPFIRKRLTATESGMEKEYGVTLQPLQDIYLDPSIYAEFNKKGNVIYVYAFSVLGILLMAIAAMNYVNLSIADFHKRNKEIGVRKVMGAKRSQIRFQVVIEAIMICVTALVVSIGLLYLAFPFVNSALEPSLQFSMLLETQAVLWVIGVLGALTIFSTAYPAYRLAVNNPVDDLKGGSRSGKGAAIGNGLLMAQFAISVFTICATYVVGQQLDFIESRNPGYDKANTIVLIMPDQYPDAKIPVIKEELGKLPGVAGISYSTFRIAGAGYYRDWYRVEIDGKMKQVMLNEVFFDHDFFKTMNIPIVAGRSFDPTNISDSHNAFIVNETAVKEFGWDDPVGKRISYGYEEPEGEKWEGTIIGVTKDFNVYSMHKKIEPLVMRLPWSSWPGQCVHVRVNGPLDQTIERIKKKYAEILPDFLIDYRVVADMYDDQYQHERKAYAALNITMWVIVLIAAVGIFSLSIYLSMRRMKEFGIRKVLGATGAQIAGIQLNHFIIVAMIANAISLPLSYWIMQTWLNEFAYRVNLNLFWFFVIAFISFVIVVISAAYSSWKSSRVNPVEIIN
jgi:putative ABC transport system permease protein